MEVLRDGSVANLLKVAQGVARITWLPGERGRSLSPGRKIELIGRWAEEIGNQYAGELLDGIGRRELRNAVFHADYMLYGSEIRLVGDGEVFTLEEFGDLSGRAHAFHDSMIGLRRYHRGLYTEPRRLPAGPISGVVVGPTVGYPPSRLQALAARRCLNRPTIAAYRCLSDRARRSAITFSLQNDLFFVPALGHRTQEVPGSEPGFFS